MKKERKEDSLAEERMALALGRIRQIAEENFPEPHFEAFFRMTARFLLLIEENYNFVREGGLDRASLDELQSRNAALYEDILPDHYEKSFANPAFAAGSLGEAFGALLSFLYAEMRKLIGFAYEGKLQEIVIGMELFLEVYAAFDYEWQESGGLPEYEEIREIIYWFVSDYADAEAIRRTGELVTEGSGFAAQIIRRADWDDIRFLYCYGEYVGENEKEMARFMAHLPQETINIMADTYTEGYRIGFEVTGKDISKKGIVDVRYRLGFERMIRRALENFEKMGLRPAIYRGGFCGGDPNRQYDYDHKDDKALFLDRNYINRKLEVSQTAFALYEKDALSYAGPAVVETFGERSFEPVNKPEALRLSEEQNRLWVSYRNRAGEIQRKYIPEEERSFTIIAFPVPEVGTVFEELFYETIRINTLDYKLYREIQQTLIRALDQADYCEMKGMGENRTDLRVQLHSLKDPERETNFENCVADVNIPVGEVFTSPMLKGTNGTLHVTCVFLNRLEYRDLEILFEDGMIKDYSCANFGTEEENRAFIKENILFRHETLPLGEFAIGTNTTAYTAARRLQVEDKLPILIAEKMGPHFAVGDTCYSHAEEISVYNPDGKEITARDNEISLLRNTAPDKAYFNCHTDITIPYDELGELTGVRADGTRIPIIREGRFVLPGTEKLNEAFG